MHGVDFTEVTLLYVDNGKMLLYEIQSWAKPTLKSEKNTIYLCAYFVCMPRLPSRYDGLLGPYLPHYEDCVLWLHQEERRHLFALLPPVD